MNLFEQSSKSLAEGKCSCYRCIRERGELQVRLGSCACGNKRCPKSSDHRLSCTNSNEPGQPGSDYQISPVSPPIGAIGILKTVLTKP